ncbi:unnamed protein product [Symbiodinium sp. KB8]|nr:unnamed protein product [Symbiodinium sp. KB8]
MAAPSLPTVPEVQYENITGEQLAADLAVLTGQTVEEVKNEGRTDLVRLATGETFVRPTAFTRVIPETAGVLVVNAEIGNGPVNLEVSAALTRMDFGKDVTRIWQRLDEFVTTDSHVECDKIVSEALAIADRLYNAQVGLAEAVYRREWNEETSWYAMTRAERMFLTKGNWHIEWSDWVMLPASVGEKFYQTGVIDLSQFPCHQLNGSFNALSAMRKFVQWFCQGCFEENAAHEGIVFVLRRRSRMEAHRQWVEASNGKMKLENYLNRQFTDHISTQNGVPYTTEVPAGLANVTRKWIWTAPDASLQNMGIIRKSLNDPSASPKWQNGIALPPCLTVAWSNGD